ncbi:hypothetical protein EJB05_04919, partial [Eragrostis curvula]
MALAACCARFRSVRLVPACVFLIAWPVPSSNCGGCAGCIYWVLRMSRLLRFSASSCASPPPTIRSIQSCKMVPASSFLRAGGGAGSYDVEARAAAAFALVQPGAARPPSVLAA